MKLSFFYHSLVSDWNHGNAHFLRGVVTELQSRGHEVEVFEPADGWSRHNLIVDHGLDPLKQFHVAYPHLRSTLYDADTLDLEQVAAESDVIIVHEWNQPWLVNRLGELRNTLERGQNSQQSFRLLFHDTHHRAISNPVWLKRFKLEYYDGILAFGDVLSDVYRSHGWSDSVWTWHEAADTRMFYPRERNPHSPAGDLVWIGNWGDGERTEELETYLFSPVRQLGLKCHLYGVRYPQKTLTRLRKDGINYYGWVANFEAPLVFANHRVTVHVPRRYYAETLPGIPTIRPFEAMACGIPLVSAPWRDSESLFTVGRDFLMARSSAEMAQHIKALLKDPDYARDISDHALATIEKHHNCACRVDQLLQIAEALGAPVDECSVVETNVSLMTGSAYGGGHYAFH